MSINGIFIAHKASAPMESLDSADLIANQGIDGDRYCKKEGTYSVLRVSQKQPGECEPGRQLTMISKDSIIEAFKRNELSCDNVSTQMVGNLRRNIVVEGISAQELIDAIGHVIEIGTNGVKIFVQRHCVPCMYNERKNGIPGMMEAIWKEAGVSCQILSSGKISIKDSVTILPFSLETKDLLFDPGNHEPGYYIPPSKRTAAMVKGALQEKKDMKAILLKIDPDGIQRSKDSYASVGLKMWPDHV